MREHVDICTSVDIGMRFVRCMTINLDEQQGRKGPIAERMGGRLKGINNECHWPFVSMIE